jgi:hypothetical protein
MKSRNLFLFSRRDNHATTLTSEFRHRLGAQPGDLEIAFFDWNGEPGQGVDPAGFDFPVMDQTELAKLKSGDVNSVTLASLTPANAAALRELATRTGLEMDRVCVFVTDDEVQRWSDHLAAHGDWTLGVQEHIDAAVIEMTGRITTWLCPDEPFGRELRAILGDHLRILDIASLPPVVTDPEAYLVLRERLRPEIEAHQRRTGATGVMVLSKPRPWPAWRGHMRSLAWHALTGRGRMVVHIWRRRARWPLHHMAELWLLIRLIGLLGMTGLGARIEIRTLPSLTRGEYLMTIFRCDVLIGAARSGGGAMAEFLRHGKLVLHPAGSVNALVNQRDRGIDVPDTGGHVFGRIAAMVADGRAAAFGKTAAERIVACEARARDRFETLYRQGFLGRPPAGAAATAPQRNAAQ